MSLSIGKDSYNADLPIIVSSGWNIVVGDPEGEAFFWITAVHNTITTTDIITLCVDTGIPGEISPVFIHPGIPFMMKGVGVKVSGDDKTGVTFTTSTAIKVIGYGGAK